MKLTVTLLLLLMLVLPGCGNKLPDSPAPEDQTKQKEAEKNMQKALENDPTLTRRGGPSPSGGTMSPNSMPGGGNMSPNSMPGGK